MALANPLLKYIRRDIPGNFNEIDVLKNHKERFLRALDSNKFLPPYEILIHPSGRCNLHCNWCIGGRILEGKKHGQGRQIPKVLPSLLSKPTNMERVINGILSYNKEGFRVENVSFSGITGEPLLAKKSFIKAVDMLSKHNIRTGVYTNATLIDDKIVQTLLKMDYINISLDAADPKTYAVIKYGGNREGKKMFGKAIKNITKLVKLKNVSGKSRLDINASFVLYPDNYRQIYKAARVLKEIGISTLRVKQDISGHVLLSKKQMTEVKKLTVKAKNLEDGRFRFIMIHRPNIPSDMKRNFERCVISDLMAAIGSDGNVYPCNYQACSGSSVYGNAIEKDFSEIWESKSRARIKSGLPKICPPVCDPFKNRANKLFQAISKSREKYGSKKTEEFIQEIINLY